MFQQTTKADNLKCDWRFNGYFADIVTLTNVSIARSFGELNRNKSRLLFSSAEMFKKPLWQTVFLVHDV